MAHEPERGGGCDHPLMPCDVVRVRVGDEGQLGLLRGVEPQRGSAQSQAASSQFYGAHRPQLYTTTAWKGCCSLELVTQTLLPSKAIPQGKLPTGKVHTNDPSLASRVTVLSLRLVIQTVEPS